MPVQTSYTKDQRRGLPGLVAWDFGTADITSVLAEGVIPFGNAVKPGSKARTGVVATSGDTIGFAVRSILNIYAIDNAVDAYGPTEPVGVLRSGYIWLKNEGAGAIADNSALYVNATGKVVNSAAAGAAVVPGSSIEIGGAVGDVVLVRVQSKVPA